LGSEADLFSDAYKDEIATNTYTAAKYIVAKARRVLDEDQNNIANFKHQEKKKGKKSTFSFINPLQGL
jgi:hypothetical protein